MKSTKQNTIKQEPNKSQKSDSTPETWHCDTYCRKVRHITCEGQGHLDPNAEERCPYFDEMLY